MAQKSIRKHVQSKAAENLALEKKKQKEFTKKVAEINPDDDMKDGTIYIGHLPRGFYEEQIRGYFTQFGTVNKVRLARSKKTGGYKGYGYIQFASDEVAKIAADAMNNYLMFDRLIKCEFVPNDKLHPAIWKGAKKRFVWLDRRQKHRALHNKVRSKEDIKKLHGKLLKKDTDKKAQLLSLGIQYDFPGYETIIKKSLKPKKLPTKVPPTPIGSRRKSTRRINNNPEETV